ncbi:unnamed protein product, partial [Thelazia callipaeda]|uniref:Intraflagellar transport protein 122 homolog n=1 Tax=Thelazia callipaeda TaxID=103827 RepID=A0A0N5CMG3_THECL
NQLLVCRHSEAIQCLAFSPLSCHLLSCAISDFGLWTQLEKSVRKQRTTSRCSCCAWSCDGQFYAIGMFDGTVSLRSAENGEEVKKIVRPAGEPIWALTFAPIRSNTSSDELFVLVDWGQTFASYNLQGNQVQLMREGKLGYDPTAVEYFNYGQFLVVCGSNRQVTLYSRKGTLLFKLVLIATPFFFHLIRNGTNYKASSSAVGCVDGTLASYRLMFSTVHGLHKERYAYRENMTDVVVQHLENQTSVVIQCSDLVRKVAVYHNQLAVQLTDCVKIYQQDVQHADGQLDYRLIETISSSFQCSLLVLCSKHLIICQEKRLQCYDHKGLKQREWILESLIRYIKVIGGPSGREAILIGLRNGIVCKIFVDNPFPIDLLCLKNTVRCLDISHLRRKLAIVDGTGVCMTFSTKSKQLLFQEPSCSSVAWNVDQENLLCYSGDGTLCIKADNFTPYQQRMQGFVVGFSGKRVFCLHMFALSIMQVPLSKQLYQYLEKKMYREAYKLASLGITESDWEILGHDALHSLELEIAQKAFHRTKNTRYLQLISEIKNMLKKNANENLILAYMKAYEGRFTEAAVLFQNAKSEQKTLEMLTDLRMFDQAQELLSSASGETQRAMIRKQADWAQDSNQPLFATQMFIASGDFDKAVNLMIENDWTDMLINLSHHIDGSNVDLLHTIANYLGRKNEYTLASQLYQSINDIRSSINMYVEAKLWNKAFSIAAKHQDYNEEVYLPYARWLAEKDYFDEAQKAYHMAGHDVEALQVLEQLEENAVNENRYLDAGYYNWLLSMRFLYQCSSDRELKSKSIELAHKANCYYAFDAIHKYLVTEPFTSCPAESLINIARYLAFQTQIYKLSRVSIFYTLLKQGQALGANKLARYALEQLGYLKIPRYFEKLIEIDALMIRSKPFTDAEGLLPMCYRCGLSNPLIGSNECVQCKTPFILSFITFEVLPLVEFTISDDIDLEEARRIINAEPPLHQIEENPLQKQMNMETNKIIADRETLLKLEKHQVIISEWPPPFVTRFYYNVIPEVSITHCNSCHHVCNF